MPSEAVDVDVGQLVGRRLSRLLTFPNVLVTAHQAFLTRESLSEIARVTVENLSRAGRGEPFLAGTRVEEAG
jgi:D-lactate dehydrogenase